MAMLSKLRSYGIRCIHIHRLHLLNTFCEGVIRCHRWLKLFCRPSRRFLIILLWRSSSQQFVCDRFLLAHLVFNLDIFVRVLLWKGSGILRRYLNDDFLFIKHDSIINIIGFSFLSMFHIDWNLFLKWIWIIQILLFNIGFWPKKWKKKL